MEKHITEILKEIGAVAVGFSEAAPVDNEVWLQYTEWLKKGFNAGMQYMANHEEIRKDPRKLLDEAKTVISLAFPFKPDKFRDTKDGMIACYAYGEDYHDILRTLLRHAVSRIYELYGGEYRICVDSAPIMERFWAVKSGIGERSSNGMITIPGHGNMIFLAEIITTLELKNREVIIREQPVKDPEAVCTNCGICYNRCPGKALSQNGTGVVDSRRCLSYLTIEHKGEWDETGRKIIGNMNSEKAIFGCDLCLRSCPLNKKVKRHKPEIFRPKEEIMTLTAEVIREMTAEEFSKIFKGSPLKRAKLSGLKRNIGAN